jgi:nitrogen regulatory protein PII
MKAIFIIFNQANTERVEYLFEQLKIRGFTLFEEVHGRGSVDGEPRMGTHTWPEMNSAVFTVVDDGRVDEILSDIHKLDRSNKEIGIRAFVWNIERTV